MKGGEGREGLWPKLEARTRILSVGTVCVACDMVCRNARIMRNTENVGMSWREIVHAWLARLERPLGIHKEWMTHDSYVGARRLLESLEACRPCRTLTLHPGPGWWGCSQVKRESGVPSGKKNSGENCLSSKVARPWTFGRCLSGWPTEERTALTVLSRARGA